MYVDLCIYSTSFRMFSVLYARPGLYIYARRGDTPTASIYMHPRGHPLGEHMPYVISRAHARGKLRLGCGELFTCTQCNIQNKYLYTYMYI